MLSFTIVIDDFLPSLLMNATWSSHHHTHADLGNTLEPSLLESAPSVKLMASKPSLWKKGVTYVITMTDPDAPSRDDPKWSEFCHWIAIGVPTSSGISPTFSDEIMGYKPPSPPEKTGKHRYVLLAFAPANGTTEKLHLSRPSARKHWGYDVGNDGDKDTKGVREWAAENGLVPVGESFFQTKYAIPYLPQQSLMISFRCQFLLCSKQEALSQVRGFDYLGIRKRSRA